MKVTEVPPRANWSCVVTVTVPSVEGSVRVTDAVPEGFVWEITLVPIVVPLDSVPAEVVNKYARTCGRKAGLAGIQRDGQGL